MDRSVDIRPRNNPPLRALLQAAAREPEVLYVAREVPSSVRAALAGAGMVLRTVRFPCADLGPGSGVPFVVVVDVGDDLARIRDALALAARAFPEARRVLIADDRRLTDHGAAEVFGCGVDAVIAAPAAPPELLPVLGGLRRAWVLEGGGAGAATADTPGAGEPWMIGTAPAMKTVFGNIRQFAQTDAPVLITGESGTGKELAARAIHERSDAAAGPFVAINCAGIPAELVASELFGYEKGAFTGAVGRKIGRIESAAGGTLFLDEIGDFPLALQAHLLRFLQEGTIDRLGGVGSVPVRTRIVTGTHVDLERAVAEGRFRQDLFFRINVLRLHLPPLRERGEDIVLIARYFVGRLKTEHGKPTARLAADAVAALKAHHWPGNVRELISVVRRGLTMCRNGRITAADLGIGAGAAGSGGGTASRVVTLAEARAVAERDAIAAALRRAGNRPGAAADLLGVSRGTLYSLFRKHSISAPRQAGAAASTEQDPT